MTQHTDTVFSFFNSTTGAKINVLRRYNFLFSLFSFLAEYKFT